MDYIGILVTLGVAALAVYVFGGKKQEIIDNIEKPKGPVRGPDGRFVKKDK